MIERVKKGLVGLTIIDVGMVNIQGEKHALVRLSNSQAIYIPWENVITTGAGIPMPPPARRPVSKSLTMNPPGISIRAKIG